MNNGLPFTRPFMLPFGGPFFKTGEAGGIVEPAGFSAKYLSYLVSSMTLVTGDNVSQWDDQSENNNDLTQATSANQPVLVETDVVKQSTLANMPSLLYDKEVTQDTASNQPTYTANGLTFSGISSSADYMELSTAQNFTGDFYVEFKFNSIDNSAERYNFFLANSQANQNSNFIYDDDDGLLSFRGDNLVALTHTVVMTGTEKIKCEVVGGTAKIYINDVEVASGVADTSYTYARIGAITSAGTFHASYALDYVDINGDVYDSDPTTMRKADGTQPVAGDSVQGWWATDAQLVMGFDSNDDYMDGLPTQTGDFTYLIDCTYDKVVAENVLGSSSTSARIGTSNSYNFKVRSDAGTGFLTTSSISADVRYEQIWVKSGNTLTLYLDGVLDQSFDVTGEIFTLDYIGQPIASLGGGLYALKIYSEAVSDPTNITETPDFELLPQTQYLRNNSNATASAGDSISAWLSTTHNANDNVVRFDATDDNMTPLPTTTGDFAMQFKKKANTLATTKVLFSSSTTSAEVRLNTSNQFEVVSDGGTVFTFTTTLVTSQQEINIVQRNGNDLEVYDSIGTKQVLDVTGESFTFDRVSDTSNASDSDWQEIRIYDKALSQSSIDYFYYLRDANNEILLPPLLPS